MAGPLSGVGQGAQIPLANTFKPGEDSGTQAATAQDNTKATEKPETTTDTQPREVAKAAPAESSESKPSESPRGSVIDITV